MKKLLMTAAALMMTSVSAFANHTSGNVADAVARTGSLNTLNRALQAADLVDTLRGPGPYTVFAPSDEAFRKLPPGALEVLMKPENKEQLRTILTYHVVPQSIAATDARRLNSADTVHGQELRISFLEGVIGVNQAKVEDPAIVSGNGLVYVVDRVILPHGTAPQVSKIDNMLAEFESLAIETREEARWLESTRRASVSWQSHSQYLGNMREHVNAMGKLLSKLEASKPQATILQEKAIAAARPHLETLAKQVEKAIDWLNGDRSIIARADYKNNLHEIWMSSDQLYKDMDTIIDYHEAHLRMHELSEAPTTR